MTVKANFLTSIDHSCNCSQNNNRKIFIMSFTFSCENKRRKCNGRLPFTEEEDQKLLKIISNTMNKESNSNNNFQEKSINWENISKEMGNRSVRQCKERYFHYLSPQINKKDWTPEEDSLLFSTVGNIGKKWKIMEDLFENRTEIDIRNRYYVLQRKMSKLIRDESKKNFYHLTNLKFHNPNFRTNTNQITFQINNQIKEERKNSDEDKDEDEDKVNDALAAPVEEPNIDVYENLKEFFTDLDNETFEKYIYRGNRRALLSIFNGHVYDFSYINETT